MPTKRRWTTSLCTRTVLIVAGGVGDRGALKTVEMMDITTHQWYSAADLPEQLYSNSAAVCGDCIYMLGGKLPGHYGGPGVPVNSVFTCSLSALLRSCSSTAVNESTTSAADQLGSASSEVWSRVADLPVELSTCVSFSGRLIAIGGWKDTPTTAIYLYNPILNTWNIINYMSIARYACFALTLKSSKLVIVGGAVGGGFYEEAVDSVEIATLLALE